VDLICAQAWNGNFVNALTNNGSGGFVLSSTFAAGSNLSSITAADVNGDGQVDLICSDASNNQLIVFTNNGSGGFTVSSTNNVGSDPNSIVAADINGDGKMNLICANFGGDGSLTVLTNNGGGGFVTAATLTNGTCPLYFTTADVNGDGKVDIISVSYWAGNAVSVWLNTSVNPTPPLGITMVGSLPVVVWPASATNYVLQMSTNLASGNWVPATNGIPFIGVQLTNPPGAAFFRLQQN
jgi:hypothetical protein